jgi:exonuclease III
MIVLSLNIRGIGGTLKAASFRRLLERSKPDVIFLQETLSADHSSRDFVYRFRPSWFTVAVSSCGNSGGLLVAWDPRIFDLKTFPIEWWYSFTRLLSCYFTEMAFLNIYGPCSDRSVSGLHWQIVASFLFKISFRRRS